MNLPRPALLASVSLLASLALPLSGCYGDEEYAAKKAAKHGCHRLRECNQSAFNDRYDGDIGRCRDDQYTDYLDGYDAAIALGCEYVPDEAKVCIQIMRALRNTCGNDADQDIADDCADVYDCLP